MDLISSPVLLHPDCGAPGTALPVSDPLLPHWTNGPFGPESFTEINLPNFLEKYLVFQSGLCHTSRWHFEQVIALLQSPVSSRACRTSHCPLTMKMALPLLMLSPLRGGSSHYPPGELLSSFKMEPKEFVPGGLSYCWGRVDHSFCAFLVTTTL